MRTIFFLLAFSFGINQLMSQGLSAKVVDSNTGEPIPFATVVTGEHSGLITNEEGMFAINTHQLSRIKDSIFISSMGYEKARLWHPKGDTIINLEPKTFELAQVFINSNPLTAKEVIKKVKENLVTNYTVDLSKKKIFFRQSDLNIMEKVDFGFKKSSIEELNEELFDEIATSIPRESSYYKEAVGDFYGDYRRHKLYIDKAAELYDKNKDVSIDGLSDRLERIFKENVKPDSYFKIRSGLIGTKVEMDSIAIENEEEAAIVKEEREKHERTSDIQSNIKDRISELYEQLFFNEDSELDILEKSNRYQFTHEDYTFIDDAAVYIIKFEPKGSKDFKGILYVNVRDFAIMRLEFENVRPLKKFNLLGLHYSRSLFKGKMLFTKESSGYGISYMELEDGSEFGLDRPLNVIEKNKHVKGRRKQNELALHLDIGASNIIKYELVVFSSENISDEVFEQASENPKVNASYLSKYDPNFWKEYTIMEPNEAIQAFEVFE